MCKVTPREVIEAALRAWDAEDAAAAVARQAADDVKTAPKAPRVTAAETKRHGDRSDNRVERCRAYLKTLPPSVEGSEGSKRIFHAARVVWNDFGIDVTDGYQLLEEYNLSASPPWEEDGKQGLRRKWNEAAEKGPCPKGRGWRLEEDRPNLKTSSGHTARVSGGGDTAGSGSPAPEKESVGEAPLDREFFDPCRLAPMLVLKHGTLPGMIYHRSEWWKWAAGQYTRVDDTDIKTAALAAINAECIADYRERHARWKEKGKGEKPKVYALDSTKVNNAVAAAAAICHVTDTAWPVMLAATPPEADGLSRFYDDKHGREYIAVANGLIDVEELVTTGSTTLIPPTPLYFTPATLPVAFDPDADCPVFLKFLDRVTENDPERRNLLQEMMGYLLRFDTRFQTFFVLTGPGGNGKSSFLAVLHALIGGHNISSVPLEQFGERFALTATLGKLVNAVAEVGELDRIAESTLKAFVGGDPMNFDRKHKTPLERCPTARLVLSCNTLPHFSDRSEGVWRRYQVCPFTAVIPPAEKVIGMDKAAWWEASGELPGILNFALAGLHRLCERNTFSVSANCDSAKQEHRNKCNPHRQFLKDYVAQPDDEKSVTPLPVAELYAAYAEWCRQSGRRPLADSSFGQELRKEFPMVGDRTRPTIDGMRLWCYPLISWAESRPFELLVRYDKTIQEAQEAKTAKRSSPVAS